MLKSLISKLVLIFLSLFKLIQSESDLELFGIGRELLLKVFDCLFNGLNDYTTDSKGDSGSK